MSSWTCDQCFSNENRPMWLTCGCCRKIRGGPIPAPLGDVPNHLQVTTQVKPAPLGDVPNHRQAKSQIKFASIFTKSYQRGEVKGRSDAQTTANRSMVAVSSPVATALLETSRNRFEQDEELDLLPSLHEDKRILSGCFGTKREHEKSAASVDATASSMTKRRKPTCEDSIDASAAVDTTSGPAMELLSTITLKDPVLVGNLECTVVPMGTPDLQATKHIINNAIDSERPTLLLSNDVSRVVKFKKKEPEESGEWSFVTTICTIEDDAYIRLGLNTDKAKDFVENPLRENDRLEYPVLHEFCKTYQKLFPDFIVKMNLYPGGGSTRKHVDGDKNKQHGRFLHHANKGKSFFFEMTEGGTNHSVTCKNNKEHIIIYGTKDSYSNISVARHRGYYNGNGIGLTVVLDPLEEVEDKSSIVRLCMVAFTTAAKNTESQAVNFEDVIIEDVVDNIKEALAHLCANRRRNTPLTKNQRYCDSSWNEHRCELRQFQDENNHLNLSPSNNKQLYLWVLRQRLAKKEGTLAIARQIILEEMDFDFHSQTDKYKLQWSTRLAQLIKYKKDNGDTLVPCLEGQLGSWVYRQRHSYRNDELSDEHILALNNIEFEWNPKKTTSVKTATRTSIVTRNLLMKHPTTGLIERYDYDFETMTDGKTYFCCKQPGCNQNIYCKNIHGYTQNYKKHLQGCIKKAEAATFVETNKVGLLNKKGVADHSLFFGKKPESIPIPFLIRNDTTNVSVKDGIVFEYPHWSIANCLNALAIQQVQSMTTVRTFRTKVPTLSRLATQVIDRHNALYPDKQRQCPKDLNASMTQRCKKYCNTNLNPGY